jgi:hypothetical protein
VAEENWLWVDFCDRASTLGIALTDAVLINIALKLRKSM